MQGKQFFFFLLIYYHFIWKPERERERHCLIIHLLVYSLNGFNSHAWARLKLRTWNSIWVPLDGWQDPKKFHHHLLLPRVLMGSKLIRRGKWGLQPGSNTGCKQSTDLTAKSDVCTKEISSAGLWASWCSGRIRFGPLHWHSFSSAAFEV